jgi:Putative prokaryotic signal transducing protein
MSANEQLVTIRSAKYLEAQIIKGRLESEGIPVLLSYESAGLVYGITVDGLGEVKIMVPRNLEEEARGILGVEYPDDLKTGTNN